MRSIYLVAFLAFGLFGYGFAIVPSIAGDENEARSIAIDVALASWTGGACSSFTQLDKAAVESWSLIIAVKLDGDVRAAKDLVGVIAQSTPKIAEPMVAKMGLVEFCAAMFTLYGDAGSVRPGLLRRKP